MNIQVIIENGERKDPAGGLYITKEILEELQNIVGTENATIGTQAFSGCTSLENVTLPTKLTLMGENAFYKCTKIKEITIPNTITNIAAQTFFGCTSLKTVTMPNLAADKIGEKAFYKTSTDKLAINTLTVTGSGTFTNAIPSLMPYLTSITLEVNSNNLAAIELYKKYGFKNVGLRKKYYNNTFDAIIMTKEL